MTCTDSDHPVRRWQEQRGLTDQQLYALIQGAAARRGDRVPSAGHLRNVLDGHASPSTRLIDTVATACGVDAALILGWHAALSRAKAMTATGTEG